MRQPNMHPFFAQAAPNFLVLNVDRGNLLGSTSYALHQVTLIYFCRGEFIVYEVAKKNPAQFKMPLKVAFIGGKHYYFPR